MRREERREEERRDEKGREEKRSFFFLLSFERSQAMPGPRSAIGTFETR
jgi:hypothetical protein